MALRQPDLSLQKSVHQHQQRASDPHAHVVVHASAGSGKTKVLIDRLLRLLLKKVPLEQIVCLTFTKAAAHEMLSRLEHITAQWITLPQEELQKTLQTLNLDGTPAQCLQARGIYETLLSTSHRTKITTLHSFCQSLLNTFPLEAQVSPGFSLLEPHFSARLLKEVIEEHLENIDRYPDLKKLLQTLSPDQLIEFTLHLSPEKQQKLQHLEADQLSFDAAFNTLDSPPFQEKDLLLSVAESLLNGSATDQQRAEKLLQGLQCDAHIWSGTQVSEKDKAALEGYLDFFFTTERRPRKKLLPVAFTKKNPQIATHCQQEADRLFKVLQKKYQENSLSQRQALIASLQHILSDYQRKKNTLNALDYGDFILKTKAFLAQEKTPGWVSYKLGTKFQHLLIDEAQDMSPLQWQVAAHLWQWFFEHDWHTLEEKPTVFLVGDQKQSIYRFQGAAPAVFQEVTQDLLHKAQQQKAPFHNVQLAVSFRSSSTVLEAVDRVFSTPHAQEHLFTSRIKHHAFHQNLPGSFSLLPLIPVNREDPDHAAELFAEKVKDVLNTYTLSRQRRTALPKDIMVLFQQRAPWMERVIQALKKQGIPVIDEDRLTLHQSLLIQWLQAFCHLLFYPSQQAPYALALGQNSPFALSLNQIHSLAQEALPLSQAFSHYAPLKRFFYFCERKIHYNRPSLFFIQLFQKLKEIFPDHPFWHGQQIIDLLINLCEAYEREHTTVRAFLFWLNQQHISQKFDLSQEDVQGPGKVFCTTIHGAKGLQAPVVILADTTRTPPVMKGCIWPEQEKTPWILPPLAARPDFLSQMVQHEQEANLAESSRLLYVAMTRAEEHLIIAGFQPQTKLSDNMWATQIRQAFQCETTAESSFYRGTTAGTPLSQSKPTYIAQQHTENMLPPFPLKKEILSQVATATWQSPAEKMAYQKELPLSAKQIQNKQNARAKGNFAHQLLQAFHPNKTTCTTRYQAIKQLYQDKLLPREQQEALLMIQKFTSDPQFHWLFDTKAQNIKSEVPLCGCIGKTHFAGRIDRLLTTEKQLTVIEFKTGFTPSWEQWVAQTQVYQEILEKAQKKPVKSAIIWVPQHQIKWLTSNS